MDLKKIDQVFHHFNKETLQGILSKKQTKLAIVWIFG